MQRDLDFIAGKFLDYEFPKEKKFLLNYFKTDVQRAFVYYFTYFGDTQNFIDHTGFWCADRTLITLKARYKNLLEIHKSAKQALSEEAMEVVYLLETGKLSLKKIKEYSKKFQ